MALPKAKRADLRRRYPLYIEIGLMLALGLLILAFRIDWAPENAFEIPESPHEFVPVERMQPTQHPLKPPPPPRPSVPVVVPDDEVLEDEGPQLDPLFRIDEPPAPPPPPTEEEEEEEEPEIFVIVEEMPELIGGLAELQRNIRYPEIAKKAGVEGRVIVQFVVDEQGNVLDPVVVRGVGAGLDEAAIEAVRKAKFKPGKQRGKAVRVKMSLPITFKLK